MGWAGQLRWIAAAACCISLSSAQAEAPVTVTAVDPLTVQDDDFSRHPDPAEWRGLRVQRVEFQEERAQWRLWRITNLNKSDGPLWVVPHDDENAGFEAALVALRSYGGTLVAMDSGVAPGSDGVRRNRAVDVGRPIDPNRNFRDGLPLYAAQVLGNARQGRWPVIALHTNSYGFEPGSSTCPATRDSGGSGGISILRCSATFTPSRSQGRAWPFDDDDTLAITTYRPNTTPYSAYCGKRMVEDDFNVSFERVSGDGSLSNYAVLHGLAYLNFETLERGLDPAGLAEARRRLVAMVDRALDLCTAPDARLNAERAGERG